MMTKFIELGSNSSYSHTDGKEVAIERRRQSVVYDDLYAPFTDFHIGEIVEAGWVDKEDRKYKSIITNIREIHNDFDDERTWVIKLKRIENEDD